MTHLAFDFGPEIVKHPLLLLLLLLPLLLPPPLLLLKLIWANVVDFSNTSANHSDFMVWSLQPKWLRWFFALWEFPDRFFPLPAELNCCGQLK